MFKTRSNQLERIDTGDYTPEEYERFLTEIAFINKYLGDARALRKTLFHEIEKSGAQDFSVLDVASGSGELLRAIADFARRTGRNASLTGIDLNPISAAGSRDASVGYSEIKSVRGDAFELPFADRAFDYAISSLFFHHLTDEQIPLVLNEMTRIARRGIFVIDLHRHPIAYASYKIFCTAIGISKLVRQDGSLSIRKGFKPRELEARNSGPAAFRSKIERSFPFRLVLSRTRNEPDR